MNAQEVLVTIQPNTEPNDHEPIPLKNMNSIDDDEKAPMTSTGTRGPLRVSKQFKGKNKIWCNGKYFGGSQYGTFSCTLSLMIFPAAGYYACLYEFYMKISIVSYVIVQTIACIFTFFSLFFLFRTNLTDPGVIPRRPPDSSEPERELRRGERYCRTCHVIRPVHAKHCTYCDNCVRGFDHHCPWVGTCVAERNIRYFLGFTTTTGWWGVYTALTLVIAAVTAPNFRVFSNLLAALSIVLIIYSVIIALLLVFMSADYYVMISKGETLNERIKHGGRVLAHDERPEDLPTGAQNLYRVICADKPESEIFESVR